MTAREILAIELLQDRVADLETRNFDLLKHNNELLARARKAEFDLNRVEDELRNT
jgi:hypothetical protein